MQPLSPTRLASLINLFTMIKDDFFLYPCLSQGIPKNKGNNKYVRNIERKLQPHILSDFWRHRIQKIALPQ